LLNVAAEWSNPVRALILLIGIVSLGSSAAADDIAFTHATVIDTLSGSERQNMTVVVRGDKIVEVFPTGAMKLGAALQRVDASGKYLIPGLWDMHVHAAADRLVAIPAFVANGITGVRSMGEDFDGVQTIRQEIVSGKLVGPRIFASGKVLDGPNPVRPSVSIAVSNPEEARAAVDRLKRQGVDFVKVYSLLPRDAYFAIADESKKLGITFAGHVPLTVTAAEASEAGQKSFEHLLQVMTGASTRESEMVARIPIAADRMLRDTQAAETFDPGKAKALFAMFARNGTWQTPTLVILHVAAYRNVPGITDDSRHEYFPSFLRRWNFDGMPPTNAEMEHRAFDMRLKVVSDMYHAGVRILAGTDTPALYMMPGFSLHDELQWLVKAGLTPLAALQAATIGPAEFLGITDSAGSISKGKAADLVLLNADPIKSIANTQKIESVVIAGRYLDRRKLDRILGALKAGPPRPSAH
jgi:hypothetical protein